MTGYQLLPLALFGIVLQDQRFNKEQTHIVKVLLSVPPPMPV